MLGLTAPGLFAACGGNATVATATSTAAVAVGAAASTAAPTLAATTASAATATTASMAASTSPSVSASAPAVAAKGITLRLYDWDSDFSSPPKAAAVKAWGQQHGYTVEFDNVPGNFTEKLLADAAGGTPFDVTKCWSDIISAFSTKDALVNLDPYMARDLTQADLQDWLPVQLQATAVRPHGHQLGLPKYINTSAMWGNRDLFQASGVALPGDTTTWDQYRQVLPKLTKKQGNTYTQFGMNSPVGSVDWALCTFVWAWGGEVAAPSGTTCFLDQAPALDALQFAQDLVWKDHVAPQPADATAFGKVSFFEQSKVASQTGGASSLFHQDHDVPKFNLFLFQNPIGPSGKHATFITNDAYAQFKGTKNPDASWQLLRFVTSPEWGRILLQTQFFFPARRSLQAEWLTTTQKTAPEFANANLDVYIKGLQDAKPEVYFADSAKANAILGPAISNVYQKNTVSAREAFKAAAPQVTAALKAATKG